ncbi:MAG: type II toxin-antitoxin system Phd/YefM family antitoxin [Desulfatiglandaceae bacterium]|nr:type II toxin-antitoxin system Phd/YefM family antitoxin [Deltaproteobacteria bacterium]
MTQMYSLTEAKAKLSELISRVHFGNEAFTITRKGKAVAVVLPVNRTDREGDQEGLILAKGALEDIDEEVDDLVKLVYHTREHEMDRKVDL